jgi:hypothetical protein
MRSTLLAILLCLIVLPSAFAETPPSTRPTTAPTTLPTHRVWRPSTQPVEVPFKLTDTNHLLIRLEINGKGPFNFIVDTGSPAMIVRVPVGEQLGLKPTSRGVAYLDKLEIEGGAELHHEMCIVETPYQIEGMNAIGASGVELDGLLGYSVLAKFRLQIDMTRDRMLWTPINFNPPPLVRTRGGPIEHANTSNGPTTASAKAPTTKPTTRPATQHDARDEQEAKLEATGGIVKLLGPLIKTTPIVPKVRGFIGIELSSDATSVSVLKVLGGSPAAQAGVQAGDKIVAVNDRPVKTIAEVQHATARTLASEMIRLTLRRGTDPLNLNLAIIAGEGF